MKKFYCFTAGQLVPSWVVDFVSDDPESEFNNISVGDSASIFMTMYFSTETGTVTENVNGVSTVNLSATVTDDFILQLVNNVGGFTVNGNNVTAPTLKIKATSEGFESIQGFDPGILVKFDSEVGDKYNTAWGNVRTVTHKSTTNDYYWDGMNIKVLKVEEPKSSDGVTKIIYYANHNWGIVGVEFVFETGNSLKFPVELTPSSK